MALTQFIQNKFQPTNDQQQAFSAIENFLDSESKVFLLKGYAGTGKTTMTKFLADYLKHEKINFVLIAPTGRAARILEAKTGHRSTTIHKGIYNLDHIDEEVIREKNKTKYKFRYELQQPNSNVKTIYLIDEVCMISDVFAEDDFFIFGSGHLLRDIISFIRPHSETRKDKIIFIGDPAQLPPVTDPISRALSIDELRESYNLQAKEYELKEVVRQKENSGILEIASYLRAQLENKKRNTFQLKVNPPDVKYVQAENVVDVFMQENPNLDTDKSIMITYSNRAAFDYNMLLRERIFSDQLVIEKGDTLLINQNNYNYVVEIMNGTLVKVLEVGDLQVKSNMLAYDASGGECRVTHKFRRLTISVPHEGECIPVPCMILENFLYSPERNLSYEENIALYLDFKIRHQHLKPKTKAFADALRQDPFFNVLRVKYGYAITCHKAQGGEWEAPIVNLKAEQNILSNSYLRWAYTAITRASKRVYLINVPGRSRFSGLNYKHQTLSNSPTTVPQTTETIVFAPPENIAELREQLQLNHAEEFLRDKHLDILARIQDRNISITARLPKPYQEHYTFGKEGKQARLTFHYNGKKNFTSILAANGSGFCGDFSKELCDLLTVPVDILYSNTIQTAQQNEIAFEADDELQVLFSQLNPIVQNAGITIEQIEHKTYQEVYHFTRRKEKAAIGFYYNDLKLFTSAYPILTHCNSNALLDDLRESIKQLKKL